MHIWDLDGQHANALSGAALNTRQVRPAGSGTFRVQRLQPASAWERMP